MTTRRRQHHGHSRQVCASVDTGWVSSSYLQLMESRGKENRVQEVAEISRGLKQIARELEVPILALSQLSRTVEIGKPAIPKLSHLRSLDPLSKMRMW